MAMLAEPRRKTRYVLQPKSKPLWTSEAAGVQFGMKMMEKMGWTAGKGLGASEQGIQEPVRAIYKQDSKGVGFKGDGNPFHNQDEFDALLKSLGGDETLPDGDDVAHTFQSLEEKSKNTKSRVHYKKFTRGKDISRYSKLDLASIVGSGKKEKLETEVEPEEDISETAGNVQNSFGVTTIHGGSIADYFKMKTKSFQLSALSVENNSDRSKPCLGKEAVSQYQAIGMNYDDLASGLDVKTETEINQSDYFDSSYTSDKGHKQKKRSTNKYSDSEIEKSACSSQSRSEEFGNLDVSSVEHESISKKKKKLRKEKKLDDFSKKYTTGIEEIQEAEEDTIEGTQIVEEMNRKKKKKKNLENCSASPDDSLNNEVDTIVVCKSIHSGDLSAKRKKYQMNEVADLVNTTDCQEDNTTKRKHKRKHKRLESVNIDEETDCEIISTLFLNCVESTINSDNKEKKSKKRKNKAIIDDEMKTAIKDNKETSLELDSSHSVSVEKKRHKKSKKDKQKENESVLLADNFVQPVGDEINECIKEKKVKKRKCNVAIDQNNHTSSKGKIIFVEGGGADEHDLQLVDNQDSEVVTRKEKCSHLKDKVTLSCAESDKLANDPFAKEIRKIGKRFPGSSLTEVKGYGAARRPCKTIS